MSPNTLLQNKLVVTSIAVLAVAGAASAAIALAYLNASSAALGTKPPPVVWSAGPDGAASDYVPGGVAFSANRTTFTATLRGVPEASVTYGDLVRLQNQNAAPQRVTISSTQVANPLVLAYRFDFLSGSTVIGTLDMKAPNPSASLGTLAPGATVSVRATIDLASGAGANTVGDARSLAVAVAN